MLPDEPAKTLTQNSGVFSSDNKGHYCENRVLSLREILILSTVYDIPKSEGLFDGHSFDWNLEKAYDFSSQMPTKKVTEFKKHHSSSHWGVYTSSCDDADDQT